METEKNVYPIGRFVEPTEVTAEMRADFIARLDTFPLRLLAVVNQLSAHQLTLSYRENGWNARQIIHHLADSHVNAYIRFKLALTEDQPTIKPYEENSWSALEEVKITEVRTSVSLIESLHVRWVNVLKSMTPEQFERTYFHPQYKKAPTLNQVLALYAWHADHHLGQVEYILKTYATA